MRPQNSLNAAKIAIPVFAGYLVGRNFHYPDCSSFIRLSLLAGLILAVFGLFAPTPIRQQPLPERLSSVLLIVYITLLLSVEIATDSSLLDSGDVQSVLWAVGWLSPLLIGGVLAPSRPFERARWPWWLLIFAASTILTYDAISRYSRVGFLFVAYE